MVDLTVRESNRWCVVQYDERPSAQKLRREILRGEDVASGFSVLTAPARTLDACGEREGCWLAQELARAHPPHSRRLLHRVRRCLHAGLDTHAVEVAELTIEGTCIAGFAGYGFYEQQNLMDLSPEGRSTLKGPVVAYFARARRVLAAMAGEQGATP